MLDIRPLLEREIPHLRRYAFFLTRDHDRADDLVQDTLCRAIDRQCLWKQNAKLRAWLFSILYNLFVSDCRRHKREVSVDETSIIDHGDQHSCSEIEDIDRLVSRLPDDQRIILLMNALDGLSYDEISYILNIPIGTVCSRLSRARSALRESAEIQNPRIIGNSNS